MPAAVVAAEMREFVDLRAQVGLVQTPGWGGALTLMAGNLGLKDKTLDIPDDWGLVIGLRALLARTTLHDGEDAVDINLASGMGLIGIGYYVDKRQHCELCLGYGMGLPTVRDDHGGIHNDGDTTTWAAELGWYWTERAGYQVGVNGGWSWTTASIKPPLDAPTVDAAGNGLNLAVSVGYRF